MAAGYNVEFFEKPDPLLQTNCVICHLVLKIPCETTCCGVYFCKCCLEELERRNMRCPQCDVELVWQVSKAQKKLIKQLKVVCQHKDRGCDWVGELGQLDKHLNGNSSSNADDCQFVLETCPRCHKQVKRAIFKLHKTKTCPYRDVECPNHDKGCEWLGQLNTVDRHLNLDQGTGRCEGCGYVKLDCVHKCGEKIDRLELEQHEQQCGVEMIECKFKILGCTTQVPRKDMPQHLSGPDNHIQLVCQAYMQIQFRFYLSILVAGVIFAFMIGLLAGFYNVMASYKEATSLPIDQSHLLQLPANLIVKNYADYRKLGTFWMSPPLSWPDKDFTFFLTAHFETLGFMVVQFRTSSRHLSKTAIVTVELGSSENSFLRHTFQVEFTEWGSQNEVLSKYYLVSREQAIFSDTLKKFADFSNLKLRVIPIEVDGAMYSDTTFAVCNILWKNSFLFDSPYGLVKLSQNASDVMLSLKTSHHMMLSQNLTFSFYLLSGNVVNRTITFQKAGNYSIHVSPLMNFLNWFPYYADSCLIVGLNYSATSRPYEDVPCVIVLILFLLLILVKTFVK